MKYRNVLQLSRGWIGRLSCRSKRKRKQRTTKVDNELDADTLQLLAENSYLGVIRFVMSRNALSAESTADNVVPESKRIQLTTKSKNLTESIEKEV